MNSFLQLSSVKILQTGADGGHIYIRGRGFVPSHGECDIYAYFRSKEDEQTFERQFSGDRVVVDGAIEIVPGIGASVREIVSWNVS